MINLRQYLIIEANNKRPSGLGQIKDNSEEVDVEFIGGDIYDLSDSNRYTEKFKYYSGDGDGYITDKSGTVYDVVTSQDQGDAGRIAGGSTSLSVVIKNVGGKNIRFRGFSAVFSRSYGMNIIEDIKDGMYLEDYIAKNWDNISNSEIKNDADIIKLKDAGDIYAKTYKTQKAESAAAKEVRFWERYIILGDITVLIKENGIDITLPTIDSHYKNKMKRPRPSDNTIKVDKDDSLSTVEDWEMKFNQFTAMVVDTLTPIVVELFYNKFHRSIYDMCGVKFTITRNRRFLNELAFDIKKKTFVTVQYGKSKLAEPEDVDKAYPVIGPEMTLFKNLASERTEEIFINAAKEWKKINKGKQKEWVDKYYKKIWDDGNSYHWLYGKSTMTKSEARAKAAADYKKYINNHDWKLSGNTITFMTEFLSQFIISPEKIEDVIGHELQTAPLNNPSNIDSISNFSKKFIEKQEEKMKAWHDGKRQQNVTNCSDDKLKLNYKICNQKGYYKEADILGIELERRGYKTKRSEEKEIN